MSKLIKVDLDQKAYDIRIGEGEIKKLPQFLITKSYSKIFIVTDKNVAKLHLKKLKEQISGFLIHEIIVKSGEKSKNFAVFQKVSDEILKNNVDRKSLIIAFGGGVVGDLTGFVASVILRGVDFIQIPTTLLAAVDSSVGGKTAINSKHGKNLIGSFYQPKLVICDLDFLETLPEREIRAGYAEVLKYALIQDRDFFEYLEENQHKILKKDKETLANIIAKSCECKAKVVAQDEKEMGLRATLNFGHTFGHIFEAENNYKDSLLHGEAVGIGMLMASLLSKNLGFLRENDYEKIKNHIEKTGLDFDLSKVKRAFKKSDLISHLLKDKKTEKSNLTFILLDAIGKCHIEKTVRIEDFINVVSEFIKVK